MPTLLEQITAVKLREVATLEKQATELQNTAILTTSKNHSNTFLQSLKPPFSSKRSLRIIAECKKASPSRGLICLDYQPQEIAKTYASCGAAAISVLTDKEFFQGDLLHIALARQSKRPVLRKDFIISPLQLYETQQAKADAVLLIARLLSFEKLQELHNLATQLGLAVLVEVHNAAEAEQAIALKAPLIGINHRNLDTLKIDLTLTQKLAPIIRKALPHSILIAESGVESSSGRQQVADFVDGILIGTTLMESSDITIRWKEIFTSTS